MTTFAMTIGREVLVYVRGHLVMKRWLDTGVSATFHVAPAGVRWSAPVAEVPATPAPDPGDWPGPDDTDDDDLRKPCPDALCKGTGIWPDGCSCATCGGVGLVW